jgi:hypothetical protein
MRRGLVLGLRGSRGSSRDANRRQMGLRARREGCTQAALPHAEAIALCQIDTKASRCMPVCVCAFVRVCVCVCACGE